MISTLLLSALPLFSQQALPPSSLQIAEEVGEGWRLRWDEQRASARFLFGSHSSALFSPLQNEDWEELARMEIDRLNTWFRIPDSTLVLQSSKPLLLGNAGTTDKHAVVFSQEVDGISVLEASVSVLFKPNGDLLAVDSSALPDAHALELTPGIDPWTAVAKASQYFREETNLNPSLFSSPSLRIIPFKQGSLILSRLTWEMELRVETNAMPVAYVMYVDAGAGNEGVLRADSLIHNHLGPNDISGHADAWATPGFSADSNGNPEELFPMKYMKVTSSAGNTETDGNGDFVIPYNGSSNVNVTFEYYGDFANVVNRAGSDYTLTESFAPGVPKSVALNPNRGEKATAQANAYKCVIDFREWTRATDPTDATMDFRVRANVNINDNCNAYYDGGSINFYTAGGGCANTAFSTIVAHEEGHWANVKYNSGNGGDGFGEGNSDVFAMYIYDTALVGDGFSNFGGIRNGENTRQFCGDNNGGCWGGVHADGEVLMGALWKVRRNLNNSLGNATGDMVADTLFLAWMNAYNDSKIRTYIEDHWLALDDDDGILDNGTPNFSDIDGGFLEQGFPGVHLELFDISHTPVPDTINETGPYAVIADIDPVSGTTLASALVSYQVDGGNVQTMPMSPAGGITWVANIPGQVSPTVVTYFLEVTNTDGNAYRFPRTSDFQFLIGDKVILYATDFEASSDEGWTHVMQNVEDDWQRQAPAGKAEDPSTAYSGSKSWGNDLGNGTSWNGKYKSNAKNYLRTPDIDTTGFNRVFVNFARWLAVDNSFNDKAQVRANGTLIWENPNDAALIDTSWTIQDLDISPTSADRVDAKIRWSIDVNGSSNFGGWNIDDVTVYGLAPVSGSQDHIVLIGTTQVSAGSQGTWAISNAVPNRTVWVIWSLSNSGTQIFGHSFDVGAQWEIGWHGPADSFGIAGFSSSVPSNASGVTAYLEAGAVDSSGTITDSNLLTLTIQ